MGWFRTLRRGVTWVTLGAAGGAAYITARHLLQTPQPLESALPGEMRIDRRHGGDIFYNVAGPADAAPLVLLHDFYPGASNFEFRNIFTRLATSARVYAPDWLGFGMSEHPHVAYTGEFYAGVLGGFLRDTVQRPATVLACGLASNVAVRAASDAPDLFDRLILVSPAVAAGEGAEPTLAQTVARTAQRVSLGLVPYALASTRPALRWIANSRSATTGADEEQVDHLFASAHQFGGQHALLALLSGELDLPMRSALQTLRPPALIVVGADDPKRPRDAMEAVAILNPHTDLEIVPGAGPAVFEDQPAAFIDAIEAWIGVPKPRNVPQPSIESAAMYLGPERVEEEVGGAGYVTPGVSDMGLEGPNTDTINSGTVLAGATEDSTSAGATAATGESPADVIPEAGDVAAAGNRDEQEARAGVDEGPASGKRGESMRRASATGATPGAAAAIGDEGELPTRPVRAVHSEVQSAPDVAPTPEAAPEAQPAPESAPQRQAQARDRGESATRPLLSRERPSQSTSAAARPSGARTAREGGAAKGGASGAGGRRNAPGGKGPGKGGSHQGHKK